MTTSFVVRGEAVLIGFLQAFFMQEKLFNGIQNDFRFVDNLQQNSLIVEMSESFNDETINAAPAVIIQEGGWSEIMQSTGSNTNWWEENREGHITPFFHQYTIHCVAQTKAAAKLLQSAVGFSIITFRKAIYALGVDNISTLNGGPPIRMNSPDETIPGYYDCTITFAMKMEQDWISDRSGVVINNIRFAIFMAMSELELDEQGVPIQDPAEWIQQNINVAW